MPIPGDNGHPEAEQKAQDERIHKEAQDGAKVRKDVKIMPAEPKEKNIFGDM